MIFVYSTWAIIAGFVLDLIFGDPHGFPHIIRFVGKWIAIVERVLRRVCPASPKGEKTGGIVLVAAVIGVCAGVPLTVLLFCYSFNVWVGFAAESLLCYQLLATKSLKAESMKVYDSLKRDDLEEARYNVSMIVGRDTGALDRDGVIRAVVETVAENTSDGSIAPMFYFLFGGAVLGCVYKAVNTMDSMVGYKNERYLNFGWAAAKTDDILNFLPSRLSALLMVMSSLFLRFDTKRAFRIWRRDRRNHQSPNSAQTESVLAGALGLRLAGPAVYFGEGHEKLFIGDEINPISLEDIPRSNRLLYMTAVLMIAFVLVVRFLVSGVIFLACV